MTLGSFGGRFDVLDDIFSSKTHDLSIIIFVFGAPRPGGRHLEPLLAVYREVRDFLG